MLSNLTRHNLRFFNAARRSLSTNTVTDDWSNIPPNITELMQRKLYKDPQHPLSTLITKVETFFDAERHEFSDVRVPGEKF